jgi:hypothetical protein
VENAQSNVLDEYMDKYTLNDEMVAKRQGVGRFY